VVGDDLRERITEVLDTGNLSQYYNGPYARRFEERFAAYHGADLLAIGVNSGTSALHLALEAAGVGPGDEVIVPALCFVAAAVAVVQLGAVPVICDVEPDSLMLDPTVAETLVSPRTVAIMPVHFWGYPADLPSLRSLCDERGLMLVEDAAQAPGATVGGQKTGTYGDFATFSFANRKHITCGEGGMVLTRSDECLELMRALANCGKGEGWDDYRTHGYSYRMNELTAVLGLHGLERLDNEVAARRRAADHYREVLADSRLMPVPSPQWGEAVYFKLPVLLPEAQADIRSLLVDAVAAENVSCRTPHRPLYMIPWLAEYVRERGRPRGASECPVADALHRRLIEVETGPNLPIGEARTSARAVQRVWRHFVEE
jgi:perosamine synthetase